MEICGGDEGGLMVDCTVGTIVWVRRRNGSWWPGRILGEEELSASHLMSPRSGTPVKLLGREDASVDWYNLEKSKRVKAFRCGEFDACIERAEASQGNPIKKREKYARREDAILHALELEKKQISDRNGKRFVREEDALEALPRMRGLQDFGLRIAPSKKKFSPSVQWETSHSPVDNHVDLLSSDGQMMGGAVQAGSSKNLFSNKRKRSQGGMFQESLGKKCDRRRPLVQSSAKLPVPHFIQSDHDAGVISTEGEKDHVTAVCRAKRSTCLYLPADDNESVDHSGYYFKEMAIGAIELPADDNESVDHSGYYFKEMSIGAIEFQMDNPLHPSAFQEECATSGLAESTKSESESFERGVWEAEAEDAENMLTDATDTLIPGSGVGDPSGFQIPVKLEDTANDAVLSNYIPQLHPHEAPEASANGGKWNMKGKRNVRKLAKRAIDSMDGNVALISDKSNDGSLKRKPYKSKGTSIVTSGPTLYNNSKDIHQASDNRSYPFSLQVAKDNGKNLNDFDDDSRLIHRREYWNELEPVFDHHMSDEELSLVDVELKVQASYQGEPVPLVSLMSRLNGKMIIGHPIQIEIMKDGSTCQLVSRSQPGPHEGMGPPSVWRTARRTAMQRVPRSTPSTSTMGCEDTKLCHLDYQARLTMTSASHARRPIQGKHQKKPLKRVILSSQKTRMLSSIASDHKGRGENINAVKLTRGGDCVPVKVVFSRILEDVQTSNPARRDPL